MDQLLFKVTIATVQCGRCGWVMTPHLARNFHDCPNVHCENYGKPYRAILNVVELPMEQAFGNEKIPGVRADEENEQ